MKKLIGFLPFKIDIPLLQPVEIEIFESFTYKGELFYICPKMEYKSDFDQYESENGYSVWHHSGVRMSDVLYAGTIKKAVQSAKKFMDFISKEQWDKAIALSKQNGNIANFKAFQLRVNDVSL